MLTIVDVTKLAEDLSRAVCSSVARNTDGTVVFSFSHTCNLSFFSCVFFFRVKCSSVFSVHPCTAGHPFLPTMPLGDLASGTATLSGGIFQSLLRWSLPPDLPSALSVLSPIEVLTNHLFLVVVVLSPSNAESDVRRPTVSTPT